MIGVDDQTCEKCAFRHSETSILTWSIVMWNWASKRMKKSRPFWALTKLWFTWYGLGGYSCKSPYKYSTDTLRWYATYVETSHFTLCFHKQNKGSLILHGICTTFECCLKVRSPDSFVYLSCMCFHCIFPIETHAWWIFHGISHMDSRYCFCFDICAPDEDFLW